MGRRWRLHHSDLSGGAGASIELEAEEAHHARRVLRLEPGEAVALFDGRGTEWLGTVERCAAQGVAIRLEREAPDPAVDPELRVVLYQALCRADRMEWVLQKGTEVGITAFRCWPGERSEGRGVRESRMRRWERIVIEACKQSGRRWAPALELVEDLPPAPTDGVLALLLDPSPGAPPLGDYLKGEAPGEIRLAAGPEAGFSPSELARWAESGWLRAGLGPRTLRSESAGLLGAALLLHRWGDLG